MQLNYVFLNFLAVLLHSPFRQAVLLLCNKELLAVYSTSPRLYVISVHSLRAWHCL